MMVVVMFAMLWIGEVNVKASTENSDYLAYTEYFETEIQKYLANYYENVYSFKEYCFTYENFICNDGAIQFDAIVDVQMTLSRNPEESPFVKGMQTVAESCLDKTDVDMVEKIIEDYLANTMDYYQVPYDTTFLYRARIGDDLELDIYECICNGDDTYTYERLKEDDRFEEIFTFEDGKDYAYSELNSSIMTRAAVTISGYNANSAVLYAINHAKDEPEFNSSNNGSDCANFVSKCIAAGGVEIDKAGGWYQATTWGNASTAGVNWIRTGYNNNGGVIPYFKNKGFIRSIDSSDVSKGCLMYWNTSSHVAIVTYCDGSTIKYSHHSNKKKDSVYYTYNSENVTFYKFG